VLQRGSYNCKELMRGVRALQPALFGLVAGVVLLAATNLRALIGELYRDPTASASETVKWAEAQHDSVSENVQELLRNLKPHRQIAVEATSSSGPSKDMHAGASQPPQPQPPPLNALCPVSARLPDVLAPTAQSLAHCHCSV
jgi:hypothetical protein